MSNCCNCNSFVSNNAKFCPTCGENNPARLENDKYFVILVLVFVFFLVPGVIIKGLYFKIFPDGEVFKILSVATAIISLIFWVAVYFIYRKIKNNLSVENQSVSHASKSQPEDFICPVCGNSKKVGKSHYYVFCENCKKNYPFKDFPKW